MKTKFCLRVPRVGTPWLLTGALLLGLAAATATAQTYSVLHHFGQMTPNVTGLYPSGPFVQGPDGTLYGTISEPVPGGPRTVFEMQPDGTGFAALRCFANTGEDGTGPDGGLVLSGTTLYGACGGGGHFTNGTVFKMNTDGTGFAVLKHFTGSDGAGPLVAVLVLSDATLYGATWSGGASDKGTVFKVNTDGSGFTVLKHFTGNDGAFPRAGLVFFGGTLYGTTSYGGNFDKGTVFKVNTDGSGFTVLREFAGSDGRFPAAGLVLSGATLYGTTYYGGNSDTGTVFKVNTDGSDFTVIKDFAGSDGSQPGSTALLLSGATLYGMAQRGGDSDGGTVFRLGTDGSGFTVLKHFPATGWSNYRLSLALCGGTLYGTRSIGGSYDCGTVFKLNPDGSGFTTLKDCIAYDGADGQDADLVLSDTTLYGTTYGGGGPLYYVGTVFKVNTDGSGYMVLKRFDPDVGDGYEPTAGVVVSGATLYGTTSVGSTAGGTVFKLNTNGSGYGVLKNFAGSDGYQPRAGLVLSGATLYGTTIRGGSSDKGTVFKINTNGSGFGVLKHFTGSDGYFPNGGRLVLSGGTLYGTTEGGGTSDSGTIFKLGTNGSGFTVIKHFTGSDGDGPKGRLLLSGAALYGTTRYGGSYADAGTVFKIGTDGNGFTVLQRFNGSDGANPEAGLVLAGTTLYGTTFLGGSSNCGTVFSIGTNGSGFTVLKHLTGSDGAGPGGVVFSGRTLYGTTRSGGNLGKGVLFSLTVQPPPVLVPARLPNGHFHLGFDGMPGGSYTVWFAPEVTGPWNPLTNLVAPANGVVEFEETTQPLPPRRYYRVAY